MKLFMVEFDNGEYYDDNTHFVIGVYSTQEKARDVADEIDKEEIEGGRNGGCIIIVIDIDKRIVK